MSFPGPPGEGLSPFRFATGAVRGCLVRQTCRRAGTRPPRPTRRAQRGQASKPKAGVALLRLPMSARAKGRQVTLGEVNSSGHLSQRPNFQGRPWPAMAAVNGDARRAECVRIRLHTLHPGSETFHRPHSNPQKVCGRVDECSISRRFGVGVAAVERRHISSLAPG